jgi:hypothetical protein
MSVEAARRVDRRFEIGHGEICPADYPGCTGPARAVPVMSGSPLFVTGPQAPFSVVFITKAAASTVEFHVHKDRWQSPFVTRSDVHPKDIIAVHHPWHRLARYAEDNPKVKQAIVAGEHDRLLNDKQYG